MTRGIEDMLNLPHLDDVLKEQGAHPRSPDEEIEVEVEIDPGSDPKISATLALAEQAAKKLSMLSGGDHDEAMDELHSEIMKHARDLMDLGFNMDQARARGIFEVAATMYKHAMDAKSTKRDAQLKAMKLALEERRVVIEEKQAGFGSGVIEAEAVVVEDRNELIKRLREQAKAERDSGN